jgi:hypothetical protein
MPWAFCPECETRILVPRTLRLGDQLDCPECGDLLEVIGLQPLELDYAYEPGEEELGLAEDWDWKGDEKDEDELEGEVELDELDELNELDGDQEKC